MTMEKVIIFNVSSRFAIFRKPYSTTSSLSYDFPPRTAIIGMIAAVIGLDNSSGKARYFEELKDLKIALEILNPVMKKRTVFNNLNTKKSAPSRHILTITEMLINPAYRIYVCYNNEKVELLKKFLAKKESHYTPYLGVSNCIAKLDLVGDSKIKEIDSKEEMIVSSVIPKNDFFFVPMLSQKYVFDTLPYEISPTREFVSNKEYVYNPNGGVKVKFKERNPFKVSNGKILSFM